MEVIVEFDYEAKEDDELTLVVGEIITNVQPVSDGWCKGVLRGKEGLFPDNFVKEIKKEKPAMPVVPSVKRPVPVGTPDPAKSNAGGAGAVSELRSKIAISLINPTAPPTKKPAVVTKKARVTYEYEPKNPDELALEVGQIIEVLKQEEEGWWEGSLNGKIGMFPSNFVTLVDSNDQPQPHGDEEATEIRAPKRVQGVGFGDIFKNAGGPIALRPTGPPVARKEAPLPAADATSDGPRSVAPGPQRSSVKNKVPTPVAPAPVAQPPAAVVQPSVPAAENKPQPAVDSKPPVIRAIVRYAYSASNDDELSLAEGDIITVLDQNLSDAGWWMGELRGKTGVFPDNFVELLPSVPPAEQKPQRPPVPVTAPNGGLNQAEDIVRPKKEGVKEPPARPPSFLDRKPIPVKVAEKPAPEPDDHRDRAPEHRDKIPDQREVARSGTLDRAVPAEKVLKPLTVDRPKVGPGRRPPTKQDAHPSVEEIDTPKEEKLFAGQLHPVKEEPVVKKEPAISVQSLSPPTENKPKSQPVPSKPTTITTAAAAAATPPDVASGMVTSADLAQLQREISRLREEMEQTKRSHDKRLADLTAELDEEKKTRLNLQVEIDRLKKRLAD